MYEILKEKYFQKENQPLLTDIGYAGCGKWTVVLDKEQRVDLNSLMATSGLSSRLPFSSLTSYLATFTVLKTAQVHLSSLYVIGVRISILYVLLSPPCSFSYLLESTTHRYTFLYIIKIIYIYKIFSMSYVNLKHDMKQL